MKTGVKMSVKNQEGCPLLRHFCQLRVCIRFMRKIEQGDKGIIAWIQLYFQRGCCKAG